uniref:Uncharacterized protein n=1 Tax=Tetranychus urticae TaxID=32264 RepID=T1K1Z7_TETUR
MFRLDFTEFTELSLLRHVLRVQVCANDAISLIIHLSFNLFTVITLLTSMKTETLIHQELWMYLELLSDWCYERK